MSWMLRISNDKSLAFGWGEGTRRITVESWVHDIYLEMTTERIPFSPISTTEWEEEGLFSGLQGRESFQLDGSGASGSFPRGLMVKNLPANTGNAGMMPGWRRSPGRANGNQFQYCCWDNPMDRGDRWAFICGVVKRPDILSEWAHSVAGKATEAVSL